MSRTEIPELPLSAKVRYLHSRFRSSKERAEIGSRETRRANTTFHDVRILDARPRARADELNLDTTGFILINFDTNFSDFRNTDKIAREFYSLVSEKIQALTGAIHVIPTGHIVRTEDSSSFNEAYARFIHCDYTLRNPRQNADHTIRKAGINLDLEAYEFAWYNFWQPIDHVAERNPLALIDSSSLSEGDLVEYIYTADRRGKSFKNAYKGEDVGDSALSTMPVFNEQHRFYYFPKMKTTEALVFKQLATRNHSAIACPHTSFDNVNASLNAKPRRSIEIRVMCAFLPN